MQDPAAVDPGHAHDRDLLVEEPPAEVPVPGLEGHPVRPGERVDDDHGRRASPSCERDEAPEPEPRVSEPDLLHDDDPTVDVDTVVVGLLAPADEHELALDAALRGRRREVRRNGVDELVVAQTELDAIVPVAERRELPIDDLEPERAKALPDGLRSRSVALAPDEALTGRDEGVRMPDRAFAADPRSQLELEGGEPQVPPVRDDGRPQC